MMTKYRTANRPLDPVTRWRLGLVAGLVLTAAVFAALGATTTKAAEPTYTVDTLLTACKEGLNASREHEQAAALECQQYLGGFRDAYVAQGAAGSDSGYCFPHGPDRRAEMQRAFVKWGVKRPKAHGWAASDGVLAAMKCQD